MDELILTEEQKEIKGLDKFQELFEVAQNIGSSCREIIVKDNSTLTEANNIIKNAKNIKKDVEALRKTMTAPLDERKKAIMAIQNQILKPIEEGIKFGSDLVVEYNKKLEAAKQAELAKIREEQQKKDNCRIKIEKYEKASYEEVEKCKDLAELKKVFSTFIKNPKGSSVIQMLRKDTDFAEFIEQINSLEERIRKYGKAKKEALQKGEELDDALKANLEKQAELDAASTVSDEDVKNVAKIKELENTKTKGIMRKVKFKLIDINKVPKEFTQVVINEEAIKEYIKSNKGKMSFPNEDISGIEIYEDLTHSSR